ncbi:MAG: thioredoxin fold domain-containing protein [Prevotellaceae bacterium]|jgi:thioredoxin-related protein|nr:thioredoxin fold domain-containing protein [Prevotellaceae bacterium]
MKKAITILLALICLHAGVKAQGIAFEEGTFDQIMELAKKGGKLVFLDAYASWCGPCKALQRNVFPDKTVGDYYNANFVSVKIDWEKGEGTKLQRKYRVRAYPTLMFIDPASGKEVARAEGYLPAAEMVKFGKFALEKRSK